MKKDGYSFTVKNVKGNLRIYINKLIIELPDNYPLSSPKLEVEQDGKIYQIEEYPELLTLFVDLMGIEVNKNYTKGRFY